ncbi:MAG: oligosaccharide flippase family protein [bacterium]|nr:oligosaccharide flippase family protein [bacterium]
MLFNVGFITGSNLLGRVMNLVVLAALGRLFGAEGLGGYSTAVAVTAYFVFVVDFGLSPRLVREGAVSPKSLATEFRKALGLKILMAAPATVGLIGLCLVLPYERWVLELCFLLGLASIIRSFSYLNSAVCRASERLDLEAVATLVNSVTLVASTLICFSLGYSATVVGYTSLAAATLQWCASALMARRFVRFGIVLPPEWRTVRLALPYATTSFTMLAFGQIDVLIVSMIESQEFVGRYASISRLLAIAGTLGSLAGAAILPTATRIYSTTSPEQFRHLVNGALRSVLLLSGATAIAFGALARPGISSIYGAEFVDLYPILRAGSVFLLPKFCVSALSVILTSCGRQGDRARSILLGLVATVVLVLILVPRFGIPGAIGAMVASEIFLLACFTWHLRTYLRFALVAKTIATLVVALPAAGWIHLHFAAEAGWLAVASAVVAPLLFYGVMTLLSGEALGAVRFLIQLRKGRNATWT